MKILFVADLHYALKQFDWLAANAAGHDAVVIGGDLLDLSGVLEIDVQAVVVEKYLNRLRQHAAEHTKRESRRGADCVQNRLGRQTDLALQSVDRLLGTQVREQSRPFLIGAAVDPSDDVFNAHRMQEPLLPVARPAPAGRREPPPD